MTRKRRRLLLLLLAMLGLGTATALVLTAFQDNLVFFYSPTDLLSRPPGERALRIGGLVEPGSVQRRADGVGAAADDDRDPIGRRGNRLESQDTARADVVSKYVDRGRSRRKNCRSVC